jgi:acyl carrier protein
VYTQGSRCASARLPATAFNDRALQKGNMDQATFYAAVRKFLGKLAGDEKGSSAGAAVAVAEDANLFDLGLLDSFSIIQLILFIEELTGTQLTPEVHDPESFYTLRGMYELVAT